MGYGKTPVASSWYPLANDEPGFTETATNVRVAGARDFIVEREPGRDELIGEMRRRARPFPRGFRFDRRQVNAR